MTYSYDREMAIVKRAMADMSEVEKDAFFASKRAIDSQVNEWQDRVWHDLDFEEYIARIMDYNPEDIDANLMDAYKKCGLWKGAKNFGENYWGFWFPRWSEVLVRFYLAGGFNV